MKNDVTEYVLKNSRKKDRELRYDFMPSLLEIIERPANKAGTVIILSIFSLLIAAIVWACLSHIDIVVTSSGQMIPKEDVSSVKANVSGTVEEVTAEEGKYVQEGDILYRLKTEDVDMEVEKINKQKKMLETQREIYNKISKGEDISGLDTNDYDLVVRSEIRSIIDLYNSNKYAVDNLKSEKASNELSKQMAQMTLDDYTKNELEKQAKKQEMIVQQYDIEIEKLDIQISNTESQFSAKVNSTIYEIDTKIEELDSSIEKLNLAKEYQVITAPVSGYINSINVKKSGETVNASQEVVSILPSDTDYEMVCYVNNRDIADIELDTEAEIKLEAYPYNKFGTVKGKITYISPSSMYREGLGYAYLVKIIAKDKNEAINIISGLTGSVEIKIGTRTIMSYFLEPIIKGFGDSLKEK